MKARPARSIALQGEDRAEREDRMESGWNDYAGGEAAGGVKLLLPWRR